MPWNFMYDIYEDDDLVSEKYTESHSGIISRRRAVLWTSEPIGRGVVLKKKGGLSDEMGGL